MFVKKILAELTQSVSLRNKELNVFVHQDLNQIQEQKSHVLRSTLVRTIPAMLLPFVKVLLMAMFANVLQVRLEIQLDLDVNQSQLVKTMTNVQLPQSVKMEDVSILVKMLVALTVFAKL